MPGLSANASLPELDERARFRTLCPLWVKGGSRRSHSIAAPDVSDELISYYHERKTGEQSSITSRLTTKRASQWRLEAHHDDPGTPVSRCKTQPECRLFPKVPQPKPTVLIVTGNLLLSPRKMTAIGDLYRPSGLR